LKDAGLICAHDLVPNDRKGFSLPPPYLKDILGCLFGENAFCCGGDKIIFFYTLDTQRIS